VKIEEALKIPIRNPVLIKEVILEQTNKINPNIEFAKK